MKRNFSKVCFAWLLATAGVFCLDNSACMAKGFWSKNDKKSSKVEKIDSLQSKKEEQKPVDVLKDKNQEQKPAVSNSGERFKCRSAVGLIIEREVNGKREILLQKRKNTKWMDNKWELGACGHIDANERATKAAVRELAEELGIKAEEKDIEVAVISHSYIEDMGIYFVVYYKVNKFTGEPRIGEVDKCSEIKWFPIDDLPEDIIDMRREAIGNYLDGVTYFEDGWENLKVDESIGSIAG